MKMNAKMFTAVCAAGLSLAGAAQAGIVESIVVTLDNDVSVFGTPVTEMKNISFGMEWSDDAGSSYDTIILGGGYAISGTVTTGNIGDTYTYTGSEVVDLRNQLADADTDDSLFFSYETNIAFGGGGSAGINEGGFTYYGYLSPNDLAATGFTQIDVTVLDYADPYTYTDENENTFSHVYMKVQFDFITVPTPGSAALLGLAGIVSRKRRRRS